MPKLICGVNTANVGDAEGKTINEAVRAYGQVLNIPKENCKILVNGDEIDDRDTVINAGDEVEFVKAAGEKGRIAA
ncbi:MAG: MoaD/ThiS family protein [Lentisphaerae bacterium]|nr:MoaD/ThiS family protein [Lentisphaerota bacterium]